MAGCETKQILTCAARNVGYGTGIWAGILSSPPLTFTFLSVDHNDSRMGIERNRKTPVSVIEAEIRNGNGAGDCASVA